MAANGAVMRTCILGCLLFIDKDGQGGMERTMKTAIDIAKTTHADPRCLISCAIASGAVAAVSPDLSRALPFADLKPPSYRLCEAS